MTLSVKYLQEGIKGKRAIKLVVLLVILNSFQFLPSSRSPFVHAN